jgi:hypothetical protein
MAGRRIRSGWEFELRGGPLMTLRAVISYRIWIYLIRYWACPNTVDAGLPWKRDIRSYRAAVALARQGKTMTEIGKLKQSGQCMPDHTPPNRLEA